MYNNSNIQVYLFMKVHLSCLYSDIFWLLIIISKILIHLYMSIIIVLFTISFLHLISLSCFCFRFGWSLIGILLGLIYSLLPLWFYPKHLHFFFISQFSDWRLFLDWHLAIYWAPLTLQFSRWSWFASFLNDHSDILMILLHLGLFGHHRIITCITSHILLGHNLTIINLLRFLTLLISIIVSINLNTLCYTSCHPIMDYSISFHWVTSKWDRFCSNWLFSL